jgi:hypothetical protein
MSAQEGLHAPSPSGPGFPPLLLRLIAGFVALGAFTLLAAGVFLSPFALSPNAIQNDVYMTNIFLGPLFALVGVGCLLIGGLLSLWRSRTPGLSRLWLRALALAVGGAVVVAVAYALFGGRFYSVHADSFYWPPYLNGVMLGVAALMALATFLGGWFWGAGEARRGAMGVGHA